MLCSTPRVSASYCLLRTIPFTGYLPLPRHCIFRVTSFTSPSEQYLRWQNRHWHSIFLTEIRGKKYGKKTGKKGTNKKRETNLGKKVRGKNVREKKYGDKIEGKSQVTSGDVTSGQACARYHFRVLLIAPPQILSETRLYTTAVWFCSRGIHSTCNDIFFIIHKLKIINSQWL